MPKLANQKKCTGCSACADICPADAIEMVYDPEGFLFPSLDSIKCIDCGCCEKVCPALVQAHHTLYSDFVTTPFAAWSIRDEIRSRSSSGGVFAELACRILNDGGVVAGAALNGTNVFHSFISSEDEVGLLQGSKYLQSHSAGIYRQMAEYLRAGKKVLFSGTPCQVSGALSYAKCSGCDTHMLYTCDLVCHGVPSTLVFRRYLESQEGVEEVLSFRDKTVRRTNTFAVTMRLHSGKTVRSEHPKDPFWSLYFLDLVLRRSCYSCAFATLTRLSDITLGDYWGAKSWPSEARSGLSIVLVHTIKGSELLASTHNLRIEPTCWSEALTSNPRIYEGRNPMGKFPCRHFLSSAVKSLSFSTFLKFYANAAERRQFWWYPYKLLLILHLRVALVLKRIRLERTLASLTLEKAEKTDQSGSTH